MAALQKRQVKANRSAYFRVNHEPEHIRNVTLVRADWTIEQVVEGAFSSLENA